MIKNVKAKLLKIWAIIALLSVEMAIILILFFTALFAFVYMAKAVFISENNDFDQEVAQFIIPYVSETLNNIMLFFTFLGKPEFLVPANLFLIIYFLFIKRHKWYSIKIAAIALSSVALMVILKNLFGRSRPLIPLLEEARGLSFPSGHSLISVTFYGLLIYLTWYLVDNKYVKWLITGVLVITILIIGFSRIYLNVHYTSDVIAGFSIGFIWLFISLSVIRKLEHQTKETIDPVVEENLPKEERDEDVAEEPYF